MAERLLARTPVVKRSDVKFYKDCLGAVNERPAAAFSLFLRIPSIQITRDERNETGAVHDSRFLRSSAS